MIDKQLFPLNFFLLLILISFPLFFISCGNKDSGAENNASKGSISKPDNRRDNTEARQGQNDDGPLSVHAAAKKKLLDQWIESGKYLYVYFYDDDVDDCIYQDKILDKAIPELKPKATLTKINRKDPKNAEILRLFRAKQLQVPFIVLYTPDQYPVRRFAGLSSVETLVNAIPSPTQEKIISTYRIRKISVICFYRDSMKEFPEIDQTCKKAAETMAGVIDYYTINQDDPAEQNFMKKMNIDKASTSPTVIIVGLKGSGDRRFIGTVNKDQLIQAMKDEFQVL